MSVESQNSAHESSEQGWRVIDAAVEALEKSWQADGNAKLSKHLPNVYEPLRTRVLVELIKTDQDYRWSKGQRKLLEEYLNEWPTLRGNEDVVAVLLKAECLTRAVRDVLPEASELKERFEKECKQIDLEEIWEKALRENERTKAMWPEASCEAADDDSDSDSASMDSSHGKKEVPRWIGEYKVEGQLGQGSFGSVYKCWDSELERSVAIKVPRAVAGREVDDVDKETFRKEARLIAGLKHPAIVVIHRITIDDDPEYPCYIVYEFIDGSDLAKSLKDGERWSCRASAELVATIAEALAHCHSKGVFHRDVKPSNIILSEDRGPFLADFGIAFQSDERGTREVRNGTPAYMSPEQARGEGDAVGGQTDIYSLGATFYELLTGHRPFDGSDRLRVLQQVADEDLQVLDARVYRPDIPEELNAVCRRALRKNEGERYTSVADMVQELRSFLAMSQQQEVGSAKQPEGPSPSSPKPQEPPVSDSVVPKGLRSFDEADSAFFLKLVPGAPRGEGIPDVIREWKHRIESVDPEATFRAGALIGQSGCGKSSLVKAGLIPRLQKHIVPVYVEASAEGTVGRLLRAIRRKCPSAPQTAQLKETVRSLFSRSDPLDGRKLLIVLDQFEQWLDSERDEDQQELIDALRECDGVHAQCLVLVRDDFRTALRCFMEEINVKPRESLKFFDYVHAFDRRHAKKVLIEFGRAYTALPRESGRLSDESQAFIDEAIEGLAVKQEIVPVRLSVFAEMMKGREWTPSTLREVGGTEGVGVKFLEEVLGEKCHLSEFQKEIRAILQFLLPEAGTSEKKRARTYKEVWEASGITEREPFETVMSLLDNRLRLVMSTTPDESPENSASDDASTDRHFQLTHDYLVRPLREWLTREMRESRRGRALLKLRERSEIWNNRRENRHLPSFREHLSICFLTRRSDWTDREKAMMAQSNWIHSLWCMTVLVAMFAVLLWHINVQANRAERLVGDLLAEKDINRVPGILWKIEPVQRWARNPLIHAITKADANIANEAHLEKAHADKLRASLGLLPTDLRYLENVRDYLVVADSEEFLTLFEILEPYHQDLAPLLVEVVEGGRRDQRVEELPAWMQELQAGCAVARIEPAEKSKSHSAFRTFLMHRLRLDDEASNPTVRSYCVDRIVRLGVRPTVIWNLLTELDNKTDAGSDADAPILQALLFVLGGYDDNVLPVPERREWGRQLLERSAYWNPQGHPGVHAAAVWLLRRWGHEKEVNEKVRALADVDQHALDSAKFAKRRWYVTSRGQRMVILGPCTFKLGDGTETEFNQPEIEQVSIPRAFAIADSNVTVRQFQGLIPDRLKPHSKSSDTSPAHEVTFFDAVEYCNALSKEEGIPEDQWCYEPNGAKYEPVMRMRRNFLNLLGYRLPTAAEWEYACRAGMATNQYWGENIAIGSGSGRSECTDVRLAKDYEVYDMGVNDLFPHPVASRRPNPFGLFDMLGNTYEWAQDRLTRDAHSGLEYRDYGPATRPGVHEDGSMPIDLEPIGEDEVQNTRWVLGSSYSVGFDSLKASFRYPVEPATKDEQIGFRVARTILPPRQD